MASKVKGGEKVVDILIKSGADPDTTKQVCHAYICTCHGFPQGLGGGGGGGRGW